MDKARILFAVLVKALKGANTLRSACESKETQYLIKINRAYKGLNSIAIYTSEEWPNSEGINEIFFLIENIIAIKRKKTKTKKKEIPLYEKEVVILDDQVTLHHKALKISS